jgi:hypothetical protein
MSDPSPLLRQILQELDENPDTWGDVVNVSALQCIEDAIAGTANVDVLLGNVTLTDTDGGPSSTEHSRYMILDINGTPGGARDVIVPEAVVPPDNRPRTKVYLAANNTGDGSIVTVKTLNGSGIPIPDGVAYWVYCDGTDVLSITSLNAENATLAATATNALALGGDDEALFPRLAGSTPFTAGQSVTRLPAAVLANDLTVDLALSNSFFHEMIDDMNLTAPLNPNDGAAFSIVLVQGAVPPHTLTFQASTFIWAAGTVPTLSTELNEVDYLAFEYVEGLPPGDRWIGSIIKDAS